MPTLRTTISLNSADLFSNQLSLTSNVSESVNGVESSMQNVTIQPSSTATLFSSTAASGTIGIVYMYVSSAGSNPATPVDIQITNLTYPSNTNFFMRIQPGDAAYLPLYASDANGIQVVAKNNHPSLPVVLSLVLAEKN